MPTNATKAETRIELWIGAYSLVAIVLIVLPALVFVEQRLESSLVARGAPWSLGSARDEPHG